MGHLVMTVWAAERQKGGRWGILVTGITDESNVDPSGCTTTEHPRSGIPCSYELQINLYQKGTKAEDYQAPEPYSAL